MTGVPDERRHGAVFVGCTVLGDWALRGCRAEGEGSRAPRRADECRVVVGGCGTVPGCCGVGACAAGSLEI